MGFLGRNRSVITLLLAVFVLMVLLSFSARELVGVSWIERALHRLGAPFQHSVAVVVSFGREVAQSVRELSTLRRDNARLQSELEALNFKYQNLVEARLELERIRALLAYREEQAALDLILARVISRGLTTWHHEVVIDRGFAHGVQTGDAVVTHRGAVGRVIEVFSTSARVLLITDPRSAVAAVVQNGRDGALAEGDSSMLGGVRLARLPWDFPVAAGELVITSRLGDVFPRDHAFVIGVVAEVVTSADGLLKYARVVPAVDFGRLEEVLVVRRVTP
ncbi:MAG: Cell shape-determining protein MreC [Firmicutes bacterium]|nr:Cell shape-determining protein MreC [candidate division NPL-UPA2 bacterium]MBT9155660.1 Cell shape-determining protein MreC [candidate division NPL-UPA2 bacterium]